MFSLVVVCITNISFILLVRV
ncbi:MAG TPA: hypothetical protein DCE77_00955 [Methylophaga sp.]|nr:hypothetical protein [Methylophaga sp.]